MHKITYQSVGAPFILQTSFANSSDFVTRQSLINVSSLTNTNQYFSLLIIYPSPFAFASSPFSIISPTITFDDPSTFTQSTTPFTYSTTGLQIQAQIPYLVSLCPQSTCVPQCQQWVNDQWVTAGVTTVAVLHSQGMIICGLTTFSTIGIFPTTVASSSGGGTGGSTSNTGSGEVQSSNSHTTVIIIVVVVSIVSLVALIAVAFLYRYRQQTKTVIDKLGNGLQLTTTTTTNQTTTSNQSYSPVLLAQPQPTSHSTDFEPIVLPQSTS